MLNSKPPLTQEMLEYINKNYTIDAENGLINSKRRSRKGKANSNGYCEVYFLNKIFKVHRIIWIMTNGEIPEGFEIDHIDHNRSNNRIENLRLATRTENQRNRTKADDHFRSQFKGVCFDEESHKWRARISFNNKRISIGRFKTEIEAAKAYDLKAIELFGDFACVNFPSNDLHETKVA